MTRTTKTIDPKSTRRLSPEALHVLFSGARTPRAFFPDPIPDGVLKELVELTHLAPTSANTTPLRVLYVQTPEEKARLLPAMSAGNVERTKIAPATAILAHDLRFGDHVKRLAPHMDLSALIADPVRSEESARFNATLQCGYFILAARALGLDAGPMGGFDRAAVDSAFFPDGTWKTDLVVNLGYGDDAALRERSPRLTVDEIARFA
jgi:nitroreductase